MTSLQAVGIVLIAFAVAKLAIAGAALRRLRAHRAGVIGASDPTSVPPAGTAIRWTVRDSAGIDDLPPGRDVLPSPDLREYGMAGDPHRRAH